VTAHELTHGFDTTGCQYDEYGDKGSLHSLARERVNGVVANTDAWYSLFDVKPGDKLYRKPEERVHIW
jgi:predicted metalloendopeptidase